MKQIKQRLYVLLLSIIIVILIGSVGYYIIHAGRYKFIDCAFMTVISLTSVGYGEIVPVTGNPTAQIFTMLLITVGMGIILYCISTLTAILIEGELTGLLRKNKMEKMIHKLHNHYIVCGCGETGRPLLMELVHNHEPVVLLEADAEKINHLHDIQNLLYVVGDATDDNNLIAAGIERARGIIISLPSDKDNLYVTMSARMLNPKIRIITRMTNPQLEPKLRKAGADGVVSPNFIGALRMASEMIRPTVVDFLDRMLRSRQGNLRINEIGISGTSGMVGKKLFETDMKKRFNILVLGSKKESSDIEFNPPPDQVLEPGMVLIVMGNVDQIARAREIF
jgi:voltage-gated potassium channel